MLEQFSWERLGQLVGSALLFIGAALAVLRGHNKSDGKKPEVREPAPNEVRESLKDIHKIVERHKEFGDDAVDRIEDRLDKITRHLSRVEDRVDHAARTAERIEAAQRYEHAANQWRDSGRTGGPT